MHYIVYNKAIQYEYNYYKNESFIHNIWFIENYLILNF